MKLTLTFAYTGISSSARPLIPYMFRDQHTSTGLLRWQCPRRSFPGRKPKVRSCGAACGSRLPSLQDKTRARCIRFVVLSLNPGPQRAGSNPGGNTWSLGVCFLSWTMGTAVLAAPGHGRMTGANPLEHAAMELGPVQPPVCSVSTSSLPVCPAAGMVTKVRRC